MSPSLDRREVLALLVAVATLTPASAIAMAGEAAPRFVAPTRPMKLTRMLERELGDGNSIVVTRSWRVRFVPVNGGFRIEGEQIAVDVDAPPRLAGLADVERRNPQAGLFPIALNGAGTIVTGEREEVPPIPGLTAAAEKFLEGSPEDVRAQALQYTKALQIAGARMMSRWPPDVFFPASHPRSEERVVPLPGGEQGTIATRFNGRLDPSGERLAEARREIVTRLGGVTRKSLETWRLERLD